MFQAKSESCVKNEKSDKCCVGFSDSVKSNQEVGKGGNCGETLQYYIRS